MAGSVQAGNEIVVEYIGLAPAVQGVGRRVNDVLWTCSTEEPLLTHSVSQCRPQPCVSVMKLRSGAETLSAGLTFFLISPCFCISAHVKDPQFCMIIVRVVIKL